MRRKKQLKNNRTCKLSSYLIFPVFGQIKAVWNYNIFSEKTRNLDF